MERTWKTKEITGILVLLAILPAVVLSITGCASTNRNLEDISTNAPNHYVCTYDGVRHDFIVELPENPEGSPLVILQLDIGFCQRSLTMNQRYVIFWL